MPCPGAAAAARGGAAGAKGASSAPGTGHEPRVSGTRLSGGPAMGPPPARDLPPGRRRGRRAGAATGVGVRVPPEGPRTRLGLPGGFGVPAAARAFGGARPRGSPRVRPSGCPVPAQPGVGVPLHPRSARCHPRSPTYGTGGCPGTPGATPGPPIAGCRCPATLVVPDATPPTQSAGAPHTAMGGGGGAESTRLTPRVDSVGYRDFVCLGGMLRKEKKKNSGAREPVTSAPN